MEYIMEYNVTNCVKTLAKSLDHYHRVRLIAYAIKYDRLDYVRIILNDGHSGLLSYDSQTLK